MSTRILFFLSLTAAVLGLAPNAFAQDRDPGMTDLILTINGQSFVSSNQDRYFNAVNCEDPATTSFQVRISTELGAAVSQVYLWVGQANSNCNREEQRTDINADRCRPVADGAAQTVDINNTLNGLTLADLTDTGLVDCANTALQGQPYELFVFRAPPGSTTVPPEGFGIADFLVDVTPPNPPTVTNTAPGIGESFVLGWEQPTDNIEDYLFYRNDVDDPETATQIEGAVSDQNKTSRGFTASGSAPGGLDLALGESTFLYLTAVDKASVIPGEGNQSELSVGWQVTAAKTVGFCDASGSCTGCAASPIAMAVDGPSAALCVLGVLGTLAYRRRRRR
jgi:hypothetical protein